MTRYFGDKPRVRPEGEWLRISHDLTYIVDDMAGRDDLLVQISPDAGYDDSAFGQDGKLKKGAEKHPGVTFMEQGIIEIDGELMPKSLDLKDVHPFDYGNRNDYPVIWGVLGHEAGHARHTKWLTPLKRRQDAGELTDDEGHWVGAALLLEEPRVEHGQVKFRPQDQIWIQAAVTEINLRELEDALKEKKLDGKPVIARMSLLTHGRIDAGSIDPTDSTDKLEQIARNVFEDDYDKMREIWLEALDVADDDTDAMLELGRRWYELTGDDGGQGDQGKGDGNKAIMQALGQMLDEMSQMAGHAKGEANGENQAKKYRDKLEKVARDTKVENAKQKDAEQEASKVFHANPDANSRMRRSPLTGYRDATQEEMSLARVTRRALLAAYTPERAVTKTFTDLPPGRLVTSRARQVAAQRVMGIPVTVQPVKRKERRRVPVPPLKVGIIQDVSGSQDRAAAATVSGAWSLAKATEGIMDAQLAMVTFGDEIHGIISPRDKVPRVPVLSTPYGSHHLHEALMAIEGELNLMRQGYARLVVILTDGIHEPYQIGQREADLTRLRNAGVKVLWFVTDGGNWKQYTPDIRGIRVHHESRGKFQVIPKLICTEAVNALKAA